MMQATPNQTTAEQLQTLAQLYAEQEASEVMTRTLEKLFDYETAVARQQLDQLQHDLAQFETQYSLSSQEFYAQYQVGRMGDDMDFIEWASLVQMAQNLQKRINLLEGK